MLKITFLNGSVEKVESYVINNDSIKLIKNIKILEEEKIGLNFQVAASRQGLKKIKDKRPPVNFKLSEENRKTICSLWFNQIVTDLDYFVEEYGIRKNSVKEVLKTRGVKYNYINSRKLWSLDRKRWWNTVNNTNRVLVLNK